MPHSLKRESRPRVRPRFKIDMPVSRESFEEALKIMLAEENSTCRGKVFAKNADLRIPPENHHFWTPHLDLLFDDCDRCSLKGRFAPHPSVWTGFVAIYAFLGFVALGAIIFGYSQWSLNTSPWAWWIVPGTIALAAFTYGAAFIGQGLGSEQMYVLRSFVDEAIERAILMDEKKRAVAPNTISTQTK